MVVQMSDKREVTAEELAEANTLIQRITVALEGTGASDAVMTLAVLEYAAHIMAMHSAGQVVFEGKNAVEALSRNAQAVLNSMSDALERAKFKFPQVLEAMARSVAEGREETVH